MANKRSSNVFFVDATTPTLTGKGLRLKKVVYRATNATNALVLQDTSTGDTLLHLQTPTANATTVFDFSDAPIVFNNGINPSTVTACTASLIIEEN